MADKIVAEYTVKVDKAIKDLEKLAKKVDKVDDERKKTQDGFKSMSNGMVNNFKKVGAAIGLAFGAQEIISFGKEAVKLASQMEGIERAFKRIGGANSANLLDGLRKATRGTVSDLQLMQKAVQASNFKIPLESLASLFKFAQARARETGESVEYLTNSIVLGIGRKSPLILDNLGISAVELRERLKGVGVEAANVGDIAKIIGDIAEEELAKMGNQADTTADKIAQLSTVFENFKVVIGKGLINEATDLTESLSGLSEQASKLFGTTDGAEAFAKAFSFALTSLTTGFRILGAVGERSLLIVNGVKDGIIELAENVQIETFKMKLNGDELERFNALSRTAQLIMIRRNNDIEDYADFTDDAIRATKEFNKQVAEKPEEDIITQEVIKNLAYYNNLIKKLREEQANSNTTRERVRELEDEINEAVRQRNLLLGKLSKEQKEQIELEEKLRKIRSIVWENMKTDGVPTVVSMSSTLDGLNKLLNEQKDILNNSPEFSKPYKDAKKAIEELEKKIEGFNDDYIDPSQGFPDYAPGGSMSATGQGLIGGEDDEGGSKPPISDELADELNQAFQMWSDFYSSINELQSLQNELALQDLKQRFQAEEITRQEYEEKRRAILRKQARQEKANALIQATVNTALAVTAALNTQPFLPLGPIAAGIAAASGAIQIGMIAAQPTPQFEEGGFVDSKGYISGRSHKTGGVLIEAEGGEYITSKKYAQRNKDILEAINSGNWEKYKFENIISPAIEQVLEGGMDNIGASIVLQNKFNDKNLLKAIDRHRTSDKNGFEFLANELKKLKQPNRGGYSA